MKLLYNDEITPPEYQPPGFEPSENEKFFFPSNAVKVELGKVSTDLHGYKMYIKTTLSKEPLTKIYEESVLTDSQRSIINGQIDPVQENMDEDVMPETQLESQSDFIEDSVKRMKNSSKNIDCPCTCKQDSEIDILNCSACGQKQHAVCYGILRPQEVVSEFYCIKCNSEAPTRNRQCDLIYASEEKEQQDLCAMRRALVFCASVKHITPFQLEKGLKCKKELAKDLIERLEFERFIRRSGSQKFMVNEKRITTNGYCEYFPRHENKENISSNSSKVKKFSQEPNDDEDTTDTKRRATFKRNKPSTSQEQFSDFDLDKVRDLNLKDPFENHPIRRSRRTLKTKIESDDSEDAFKPSKRRCTSTRSPITLE